ncbi:hypothetical protein QP185_10460 [Sphingomonas aerolata]
MVFVPWNFHVKSTHVEDWVRLPMLATNAWRLTLLFVVSGYASRALLRRSSGPVRFFATRCYRLLVPLAFGILVIVPRNPGSNSSPGMAMRAATGPSGRTTPSASPRSTGCGCPPGTTSGSSSISLSTRRS